MSYMTRPAFARPARSRLRGLGVLPRAPIRVRAASIPNSSTPAIGPVPAWGPQVNPATPGSATWPQPSSNRWNWSQQQNANPAAAGAGGNSWLQSSGTSQNRRSWQSQAALNPAGGPPSTILKYDASGNPVYSVPPPGQVVTGYDAQGTPIYGNNSATAQVVTGYDASGNPIYSSSAAAQAAGLQITGYDAQGNPIYSSNPSTSTSALTSSGTPSTATAPAAAPAADDTSGYQSILDWLSESTLISGFPNWGIVAAAGLAVVWMQNRRGR